MAFQTTVSTLYILPNQACPDTIDQPRPHYHAAHAASMTLLLPERCSLKEPVRIGFLSAYFLCNSGNSVILMFSLSHSTGFSTDYGDSSPICK